MVASDPMTDYYSDRLSAERLVRVYEIATPRVRRYLKAEIDHIIKKIRPGDMVLELGCGYGRILPRLAGKCRTVVGIDTSLASLKLGIEKLKRISNCHLLNMDATRLAFADNLFDVVVCIQNGISAFHVDQTILIRESLRVTRSGGTVLFSSYSDKFWNPRLEWFRLQSEAGLLGEIDPEKTGHGVIVCRDGFTATTVGPEEFLSFVEGIDTDARIVEVDGSSLFCEINVP
jgi:ubiquinone/menaquinone biosynthesis C-methylase UbiE